MSIFFGRNKRAKKVIKVIFGVFTVLMIVGMVLLYSGAAYL